MLEIYVDGACKVHKSGDAGWAVIVPNGIEFGGYLPQSTNNRAELTAVMKALEWCETNNIKATIYSDSQYVVKGLNTWAKKWCQNNWEKCIKNKDIWQHLYPLFLNSKCKVKWVRGHSGNYGNEKADRLAVRCMNEKRPLVYY